MNFKFMDLLTKFFFPGFGYPGALIYQIILGGSVWALIGFLFFGWDGYGGGEVIYSFIGSGIAVVIGLLISFNSNGRVNK